MAVGAGDLHGAPKELVSRKGFRDRVQWPAGATGGGRVRPPAPSPPRPSCGRVAPAPAHGPPPDPHPGVALARPRELGSAEAGGRARPEWTRERGRPGRTEHVRADLHRTSGLVPEGNPARRGSRASAPAS